MSDENLDEMLVYSNDVTIKTTPLSVMRLEHHKFKSANAPGFEAERK